MKFVGYTYKADVEEQRHLLVKVLKDLGSMQEEVDPNVDSRISNEQIQTVQSSQGSRIVPSSKMQPSQQRPITASRNEPVSNSGAVSKTLTTLQRDSSKETRMTTNTSNNNLGMIDTGSSSSLEKRPT